MPGPNVLVGMCSSIYFLKYIIILHVFFTYHVCIYIIYLVLLEKIHSRHFNHSGTSFLKMDVCSGVDSALPKKKLSCQGYQLSLVRSPH